MRDRLTKHQLNVLRILNDGGKLFVFEDGDTGFDDKDGNTLKFRSTTFDALIGKRLIKVASRPALGVELYTISEKGKSVVERKTDVYSLQQKDLNNIRKQGHSNNEPYA